MRASPQGSRHDGSQSPSRPQGAGAGNRSREALAVEGLETAEDTLSDTANSDGTDDLVLEVVLVLGDLSNVPVTTDNLLVGGNEVADEGEDGHDDVLSDGDDVRASDLSDGNTAVGLVGSIEVDVVGTDTSSDGKLQVLGLGKALCCEVTGVETIDKLSALSLISHVAAR